MAEQQPPGDPAPTVPDLELPRRRAASARPSAPARDELPTPQVSLTDVLSDASELDFPIERSFAPAPAAPPSHDLRKTPGPSGVALRYHRLAPSAPIVVAPRAASSPPRGSLHAGLAVAGALATVTAYAAQRWLHVPSRSMASLYPRAFDGSSANAAGGVALGALVVTFALAFLGLRLRPRTWSFVVAAFASLLVGLAMVTVALASTGDGATPPDGALLIPWVLPAVLAPLALGLCHRAGRLLAQGGALPKLAGLVAAPAAGGLAFAAWVLLRRLL